ncbi:MlaD family protein [Nocardia miyunensis]|uniref:MlaD family protein n=1 Tax=Nocardia miyunensis TaxID=282684 RepID=UPI0008357498|nr:MlaD family protein [Nocardia miyunensis]
MNLRATVSLTAIALVLVLGIGYMTVGVLHLDPRRTYLTAELHLPDSGGLGSHAPVLLDGVEVGRADEVRKQASGVLVRLRVDERYRIPLSSEIRVEQLSALGEPYIEFAPDSSAGPYLESGEVVPSQRIRVPMTITALSEQIVTLLQQLHPEAMANLVDTFSRALSGTDAAMQTLQRSTTLLAAALLSRTTIVRRLFADMQKLGGDIDWLGPSLATAGPQFGDFGKALSAMVQSGSALVESRPVSSYFRGGGLTPFMAELTTFLNKIGPGVAPLAPALQPVVTDAMRRTPRVDISALIDQALHGVGPDGTVHFRITTK